ncbi:MAG: hypothetical protein ACTSRN_04240 [Alphaproteobacteria bacterium]
MCKIILWILIIAYIVALVLWAVGTFGLFGQETDPLSGIFLIPLGMPWNFLADYIPESMRAYAGVVAPLINIGILSLICRVIRRG